MRGRKVLYLLTLLALLAGPSFVQAHAPAAEHESNSNPIVQSGPGEPISLSSPERFWAASTVDAYKSFGPAGDKSLAVDAAGHPRVVYGGTDLYYAWHDGAAWHTEVVEHGPNVGLSASLALDGQGYPHISYWLQWPAYELKYAYYDGQSWHTETVTTTTQSEGMTSLALDSHGWPHISYNEYFSPGLKYAYFDGTSWRIETVDSSETAGAGSSLALDAADRPHISYLGAGWDLSVKYASYDGTSWQIEIVGPYQYADQTSLRLDSGGYPHISYHQTLGLTYAHFDGTSWQSELVDSDPYVGRYSSLALDSTGRPHISYGNNSQVRYAYYDGASWQIELVQGSITSDYTALALGADGHPYIVYNRQSPFWDVMCASYDGSSWQIERVDRERSVYGSISLVLDSTGAPHISYNGRNSSLQYASLVSGAWQIEEIEEVGYSENPSLALDSNDQPHLAYLYNGDLNYAYWDGSWHTEVVEAGVGYNRPSLVLDSLDRPHIGYQHGYSTIDHAYKDGSTWVLQTAADGYAWAGLVSLALDTQDLPHLSYFAEPAGVQYASYDGAQWVIENVDTCDWGPCSTSLALDGNDHPLLAYYDDGSQSLKYAFYDGAAWQFSLLDIGLGEYGGYLAMALGPDGQPDIAYEDDSFNLLKYAHLDGSVWVTEVIDSGNQQCSSASIAVDRAGLPHVSCIGHAREELFYITTYQPLTAVQVDGPGLVAIGETSWYTATYAPPSATPPVTLTWSSGAIGPTAAYSWGEPGWYPVTVTATNPCSTVTATRVVHVLADPCAPVSAVTITGPLSLPVDQGALYTATAAPLTATTPITFSWSNGSSASSTTYSWPLPGTYTIALTGTNPCGTASAMLAVRVEAPEYQVYLPLVVKRR